MVQVRDVREFARKNEKHLKRFVSYKTGIIEKSLVDEIIQEFYLNLLRSDALETYDEKLGSFETYIMNRLCWIFPQIKKKNVRIQHSLVSHVQHRSSRIDVWEYVGKDKKNYNIDPNFFCSYNITCQDEEECRQCLEEFIEYIKKTEEPTKAERMISVIRHRAAGCKSVDIAGMLKVSPTMVKLIKRDAERKYKEWYDKQ